MIRDRVTQKRNFTNFQDVIFKDTWEKEHLDFYLKKPHSHIATMKKLEKIFIFYAAKGFFYVRRTYVERKAEIFVFSPPSLEFVSGDFNARRKKKKIGESMGNRLRPSVAGKCAVSYQIKDFPRLPSPPLRLKISFSSSPPQKKREI